MDNVKDWIVNPMLRVKIGFKLKDPMLSPYKGNYSYYDYKQWNNLGDFLICRSLGKSYQESFLRLDINSVQQLLERGIFRFKSSAKKRIVKAENQQWERISDSFVIKRELQLKMRIDAKIKDNFPYEKELLVNDNAELVNTVIDLINGNIQTTEVADKLVEQLKEHQVIITPEQDCGEKAKLCTSLSHIAAEIDGSTPLPEGELVLNPHMEISFDPLERLNNFPDFATPIFADWAEPNVSVTHTLSKITEFFCLNEAEMALLKQVQAEGSLTTNDENRALIRNLFQMEVLIRQQDIDNWVKTWQAQIEEAKQSLLKRGCFMLKSVFTPATMRVIKEYADDMVTRKFLNVDHWTGSLNREWLENDDITTFIHYLFNPLLDLVSDEPLKPTYNYLNRYNAGATLPMHKDPGWANKYTTTLTITRESDEGEWPLLVKDGSALLEFEPDIGDMIVMRPRNQHGRKGALDFPGVTNMLFWYQPAHRTGFKYGNEFSFDKEA